MSENLQEKYGSKVPWILGKGVRIPRIKFPVYHEGSMALPSPGRSLVMGAIYIFLFYLVAGGIYIAIRNPIALGADANNKALWLYPSTHDAFVIESIVAAAVIFLGGIGFYLLYATTRNAFNYKYAIKLLIIGLLLAAVAFGLLQYMIGVKSGDITTT